MPRPPTAMCACTAAILLASAGCDRGGLWSSAPSTRDLRDRVDQVMARIRRRP
jgi:hypothetical protein